MFRVKYTACPYKYCLASSDSVISDTNERLVLYRNKRAGEFECIKDPLWQKLVCMSGMLYHTCRFVCLYKEMILQLVILNPGIFCMISTLVCTDHTYGAVKLVCSCPRPFYTVSDVRHIKDGPQFQRH